MTHLGSDVRTRLERLRASDTTGIYASDDPSTGSDPDGAMSVTIDPTLRVTAVQVHTVEPLRRPEQLDRALAAAYGAALSARYQKPSADGSGPRPRPVVDRPVLTVRRPTPEMLGRHQTRVRANLQPRPPRRREHVGTSDNRCVTVTLPITGGRGRLEVDAGWLQQASSTRLGAAITEAFAAAYSRSDS